MKVGCPNKKCNYHQRRHAVLKDGFYLRKNDSRKVQRYKCRFCKKKFSSATFSMAKNQKKRRVNFQLFKLLSSGVSMRRCAKILNIHRVTVKRKMIYLSAWAGYQHKKFLKTYESKKIKEVQFDDLITIEHTKLKPLSVSLAINASTRHILEIQVSRIPAFGKLSRISVMKYGQRSNDHKHGLEKMMLNLVDSVAADATFYSDEHNLYPNVVQKYFPMAKHIRFKGGLSSIGGQGELKKLYFDPLFSLNHTCAMLRANINRLIRKTWCTTKNPTMLKKHLDIYIYYHNSMIL